MFASGGIKDQRDDTAENRAEKTNGADDMEDLAKHEAGTNELAHALSLSPSSYLPYPTILQPNI